MPQLKPHHDQLRLADLVELVELGALALPDFQRKYVWTVTQIKSLLATIIMGWPAGLLLLMEAPPEPLFAIRGIESAPLSSGSGIRHLILDGQQRITALYEAFRTEATYVDAEWTLDIDALYVSTTVEEVEDALLPPHLSQVPKGSRQITGLPATFIPLRALLSKRAFFEWRDNVALADMSERAASLQYARLNEMWGDRLGQIEHYVFPAVVLDRRMPLEAVAPIFERLNTSGLQLDTFDLVVAHIFRFGRNLRADWDIACENYKCLRAFVGGEPQIVVELISLVTADDTRRAALLNLVPARFNDEWDRAVAALDDAARFLIDHCGIPTREELPHRGFLLVLAAVGMRFNLLDHIELLRTWLISGALESAFDAAVNTRVVREFKDLQAAITAGKWIGKPSVTAQALRLATRRGAASVWLGVQALVRLGGPMDFPDGMFSIPVSLDRYKAVSVTQRRSTRSADPACGIVLLNSGSVAVLEGIGARALFELLSMIDPESADQFVETQCLPPLSRSNYASDEVFLGHRIQQLTARIRSWRP